jgi:hypothetical protein
MPFPIRIEVRARSGRALGLLTTDGLLVLQRRGVSSSLEACLPEVHVEVRPATGPPQGWEVAAAAPGRRPERTHRPSLAAAYAQAAACVADALGEPVTAAPVICAYMYESRPCGPTEGIPDRVVSPLHYDPAEDAVRIVEGGAVVARFPAGDFDSATPAGGPEVLHVHEHLLAALRLGFHSCDRRLGDDYCKRRLTWLAGAYWLEASPAPVRCGVLQLDMTLEPGTAPA